MKTYRVQVERGDRWWIVSVPEVPGAHTQARHLREVGPMAREVIALMLEIPEDTFELDVHIKIPADVLAELETSERLRQEAAARQTEAARHLRLAVRRLRRKGLVYRDVGEMLGVSAARAKQLDSEAPDLVA
jgi:predicted RNase H-like HicB family nuclease